MTKSPNTIYYNSILLELVTFGNRIYYVAITFSILYKEELEIFDKEYNTLTFL